MYKVTDELFFIIDEQHNSIEMTDKGIDLITSKSDDQLFFILPDIGSEVVELEKSNLEDSEKLVKKDQLIQDYSIKSERIHTINQLLKAYALFEKDVEYVIMDNKVKIVDEQTGRIMEGRRYSDGLHQAIEAKEQVKKIMEEGAPGGGFIFGTLVMPYDIPDENIYAIIDAAHEFGRYGGVS